MIYQKININTRICIACTAMMMIFFSCKKFIEIKPPVDQITTTAIFSDSSSAVAAVMGIYSQVSYYLAGNKILNGATTIAAGLSADEITRTVAYDIDDQFANNAIAVDNTSNFAIWSTGYNHIYHVNLLIENLNKSVALSERVRNQLLGEIKFIRTLCYFYLVNFYGEIPLALTSDYRVNGSLTRTDIKDMYIQMKDDLTFAQSVLDTAYAFPEKVRVNKWAAMALMARVSLYEEKWEEAIAASSAVIASGLYQLAAPSAAFLGNNQEAILQFYPQVDNIYNTREGYEFIPVDQKTIPGFILTPGLFNDFEPGDLRRVNWVDSNEIDGTIYYYPGKYKVKRGSNNTDKTEYNQLLRLAEQYLIRAEAYAQTDQLNLAIEDIDQLRQRAGLPLISEENPGISKSELLDAIYHERRIELFAEWGHRWFDLKRTNKAESILTPVKPYFKKSALLFPVPQQEMLLNPFLLQNEGYH